MRGCNQETVIGWGGWELGDILGLGLTPGERKDGQEAIPGRGLVPFKVKVKRQVGLCSFLAPGGGRCAGAQRHRMRPAGARGPHTTGSAKLLPWEVGILGDPAWTRRCWLPVCPHLPVVRFSTHLMVCLSTIHRCCHQHDCCYTKAEQAGCRPKTERYFWQCVNQSIVCGESPAGPDLPPPAARASSWLQELTTSPSPAGITPPPQGVIYSK